MTSRITENDIVILGESHGARLAQRGVNDLHICIHLLVEDDGKWYEECADFSSYWLQDIIELMNQVKTELNSNPGIERDGEYGWRFKGN